MQKTIKQILIDLQDDLEDDILYCLSELSLLQNSTPEELDMTVEKIQIAVLKKKKIYRRDKIVAHVTGKAVPSNFK